MLCLVLLVSNLLRMLGWETELRASKEVSVSITIEVDAVHYRFYQTVELGCTAQNISYENVFHIVYAGLDMRKFMQNGSLRCRNIDQRQTRVESKGSICARFENDANFFNRVVTIKKTIQKLMEWISSPISCTNLLKWSVLYIFGIAKGWSWLILCTRVQQ